MWGQKCKWEREKSWHLLAANLKRRVNFFKINMGINCKENKKNCKEKNQPSLTQPNLTCSLMLHNCLVGNQTYEYARICTFDLAVVLGTTFVLLLTSHLYFWPHLYYFWPRICTLDHEFELYNHRMNSSKDERVREWKGHRMNAS